MANLNLLLLLLILVLFSLPTSAPSKYPPPNETSSDSATIPQKHTAFFDCLKRMPQLFIALTITSMLLTYVAKVNVSIWSLFPLVKTQHNQYQPDITWMASIKDTSFYITISLLVVLCTVIASMLYIICYRRRVKDVRSGGLPRRYRQRRGRYRSSSSSSKRTLKLQTQPKSMLKTEEMSVDDEVTSSVGQEKVATDLT